MNAVASPVSVSILDREYQIACPPEERPGLIAAAAYLDGKMREVRNAARSATADRIAVLPQIRELFEALKNDADGVADARIDSAFPLSDGQLAELVAALEKRFGKKIEATVNVDPALGGGARITVGDTVIDGTIEAQLAAMATQLRG